MNSLSVLSVYPAFLCLLLYSLFIPFSSSPSFALSPSHPSSSPSLSTLSVSSQYYGAGVWVQLHLGHEFELGEHPLALCLASVLSIKVTNDTRLSVMR